jgi:hypothetical protein
MGLSENREQKNGGVPWLKLHWLIIVCPNESTTLMYIGGFFKLLYSGYTAVYGIFQTNKGPAILQKTTSVISSCSIGPVASRPTARSDANVDRM